MHGRWPTRVRELYVHRLFVDDDLKLHACLALELSYGVQVKVQAYRLQLLAVHLDHPHFLPSEWRKHHPLPQRVLILLALCISRTRME